MWISILSRLRLCIRRTYTYITVIVKFSVSCPMHERERTFVLHRLQSLRVETLQKPAKTCQEFSIQIHSWVFVVLEYVQLIVSAWYYIHEIFSLSKKKTVTYFINIMDVLHQVQTSFTHTHKAYAPYAQCTYILKSIGADYPVWHFPFC